MEVKVKPLSLEQAIDLTPVLTDYDFKRYSHYGHIDNQRSVQYVLEDLRSTGGDPDSACWIALVDDDIVGLASLKLLRWDTEHLGVRAGKIGHLLPEHEYPVSYEIKSSLLETVLQECAVRKIRYLTLRLNASELSSIHLLEENGFVIIDGMLTFSYDLRKSKPASVDTDLRIRTARAEDIEQLGRIAAASFGYDRFHSDPKIAKQTADDVHVAWIENSCRGTAADTVIVGERDGLPSGFVTCKIDKNSGPILGLTIGTIVLVAVGQQGRGQGTAFALTVEALNWFRQQDVDVVEVGTQLRNIPASRLYGKAGFKLVSSSVSMRKWVKW